MVVKYNGNFPNWFGKICPLNCKGYVTFEMVSG